MTCLPDMTPSFPRIGVSGLAGAVQYERSAASKDNVRPCPWVYQGEQGSAAIVSYIVRHGSKYTCSGGCQLEG